MSFISFSYLVFLFITFIFYQLLDNKFSKYIILFSSLLFVIFIGLKQSIFYVVFIALIYLLGIKRGKLQTIIGIIISIVFLLIIKYWNAFVELTNIGSFNISFSIVGMSFLTFKSICYLVSNYKQEIKNNSVINYCIYMLFFPSFMCGPIDDYYSFLENIENNKKIGRKKLCESLVTIMIGYFMKICVADRVIPIVDSVYSNYMNYGFYNLIAIFLYPIYIYCDFAGYSLIAYGSAKLFGYELTINFIQPYFSTSIKEFWNRWHISLNNWLTTYIYIPLGGSRRGIRKKYLNFFIVFFVSGMWHGNELNYIIWGILNCLFLVIEDLLNAKRKDGLFFKIFSVVKTYLLISFTWIFFYNDILTSISIICSLFNNPGMSLYDFLLEVCLNAGSSKYKLIIMIVLIIVVFVYDLTKEIGIDLPSIVAKTASYKRIIAILLIFTILALFGIYGGTTKQISFVYFKY